MKKIKMAPKNKAYKAHMIVVLFGLLSETIDEFEPDSPLAEKMKLKASEIVPLADALVDSVFQLKSVRESTYLLGLMKKVETVIRKNFEEQ